MFREGKSHGGQEKGTAQEWELICVCIYIYVYIIYTHIRENAQANAFAKKTG